MNIRVDDDTVIAGRHVMAVRRVYVSADRAKIIIQGASGSEIWASGYIPRAEADALFSKCSASLGERSAD